MTVKSETTTPPGDEYLSSPLHVEIDTREQYPLLFPVSIKVQQPDNLQLRTIFVEAHRTKLDAGDYRIRGYEDICVVERKASQSELAKNLSKSDSSRQGRAFHRLRESCVHPILLIETSPAELFANGPRLGDPEAFVSHLTYTFAKLGFEILWLPQGRGTRNRRVVGQFILHMMLGHILHDTMKVRYPWKREIDGASG